MARSTARVLTEKEDWKAVKMLFGCYVTIPEDAFISDDREYFLSIFKQRCDDERLTLKQIRIITAKFKRYKEFLPEPFISLSDDEIKFLLEIFEDLCVLRDKGEFEFIDEDETERIYTKLLNKGFIDVWEICRCYRDFLQAEEID